MHKNNKLNTLFCNKKMKKPPINGGFIGFINLEGCYSNLITPTTSAMPVISSFGTSKGS